MKGGIKQMSSLIHFFLFGIDFFIYNYVFTVRVHIL